MFFLARASLAPRGEARPAAAEPIPPLRASRRARRRASRRCDVSPPARSTCQKVQPLQAGRPCTSAPILWIEPTAGPSVSAPSARTSAPMAALRVDERLARPDQARLDEAGEGDARLAALGRHRRDRVASAAARPRRCAPAPPRRRPASRSSPMKIAAEPARDGAGGAGAEERVEHEIAGVGGRRAARGRAAPRASASDGSCGRRRPSAARAPVQIGKNQSERAWQSSLPAFSAS